MALDNEGRATLAVVHELRELLAIQNGNSSTKSHQLAKKAVKAYAKKLGVTKSAGWLLREHYRWGKRKRHPNMFV